jgi:hypothetical protein
LSAPLFPDWNFQIPVGKSGLGKGTVFWGSYIYFFTFSFFNIWETLPERNSASCEPTIKRFPKKDEQLKTWSFSAKAKMKRNWSTRPPLDQE